jgi:hypothetical protein
MKLIQKSINDLLNNHKIVLIVISFILGILLNEFSNKTWISGGSYPFISEI